MKFLRIFYSYVSPACLPQSIGEPAEGKECWVTGWGTLSSGGIIAPRLRQVSVPVVDKTRCTKVRVGKDGMRQYCKIPHESTRDFRLGINRLC